MRRSYLWRRYVNPANFEWQLYNYEMNDVIYSLKNHKVPGNDLMPVELTKNCKLELLPK